MKLLYRLTNKCFIQSHCHSIQYLINVSSTDNQLNTHNSAIMRDSGLQSANGLNIHSAVTFSLTKNYICSARQRNADDITIYSKHIASRQRSGNGAVRKKFPLQKPRDRKKLK